MQEKKKKADHASILAAIKSSPFRLEMRKGARGAVMLVSGVIGISDYTEECVVILSHGGRLTVRGEGLSLGSLEGRALEIFGKIEEVSVGYGKT